MIGREALRWRDGEDLTRTTRTEHVALGFQVRRGARQTASVGHALQPFDNGLHWVELANLAKDPAREFFVQPADLRAVLTALLDEFGEGNVRAHALWHSHFNLAAPTAFDVQFFPPWLSIGVVWHAPSDRIALYDGYGLIGAPAEDVEPPLAVGYGSMH